MKNIKIFCSWQLKFDLFHDKQIELYVDKFPPNRVPPNTIRFLFLLEPPEIMNFIPSAKTALNQNRVNYVFTHNQPLLNQYPGRTIKFPLATTWIKNYTFPDKEYAVSTLIGGKKLAPGHHIRHKLWSDRNKINNIKRNFFISGNYPGHLLKAAGPVLGKDKSPLFSSQFHIVIENAIRQNWFTEKLMDPLQTKSVPIYVGAPNIGDWFDIGGMLIAQNVNDIVSICNNLKEDTYEKMLPLVEKNYDLSMEYANIEERFIREINKVLKK